MSVPMLKEESTMALELIKFVKKILAELESEEHKNWLVHKQTACGKDFSNPFMVDNLPKIVGLSTHLASVIPSLINPCYKSTPFWLKMVNKLGVDLKLSHVKSNDINIIHQFFQSHTM
ncbi:hypothetical protein Tco_1173955 [Tanacetum coccineum]